MARVKKGRRNLISWLLLGVGVLLLGLVVFRAYAPQSADQAEMGQPAPDFTLSDLSGTPVQLSQLKGRVVIVTFWRTD